MKPIDIEELLRWAYQVELPKEPAVQQRPGPGGVARGWDSVHHYGKLLAEVDESDLANQYGLYPDFMASSPAHEDARTLWAAVQALDDLHLTIPEGWSPLGDMGDLGPEGGAAVERALQRVSIIDAGGDRTLRKGPRRLIEKHAILGGCPEWEAEKPERKVITERGKAKWFRRTVVTTPEGPMEIEVDGYNEKRQRPYADAYRKFFLDPDPMWAAVARAEYEIWHAALGVLCEELDGLLVDHQVLTTARPSMPWVEGGNPQIRILPDLRPVARPESRPLVARRRRRGARAA